MACDAGLNRPVRVTVAGTAALRVGGRECKESIPTLIALKSDDVCLALALSHYLPGNPFTLSYITTVCMKPPFHETKTYTYLHTVSVIGVSTCVAVTRCAWIRVIRTHTRLTVVGKGTVLAVLTSWKVNTT